MHSYTNQPSQSGLSSGNGTAPARAASVVHRPMPKATIRPCPAVAPTPVVADQHPRVRRIVKSSPTGDPKIFKPGELTPAAPVRSVPFAIGTEPSQVFNEGVRLAPWERKLRLAKGSSLQEERELCGIRIEALRLAAWATYD